MKANRFAAFCCLLSVLCFVSCSDDRDVDAESYFAQKGYIADADIEKFREMASGLSFKEQEEIMLGLLVAKLTQDALLDELDGTRDLSLGTFSCNLATGGIGSLWGYMAGGVAVACGATAVITCGVSIAVCAV